MWRRASGSRRRLLHGLIQVAVGYEHCRRGNAAGAQSLLTQGVGRLRYFTRRPGVRGLRERARSDAARMAADASLTLDDIDPPRVMVVLEGLREHVPRGAIEIAIPRG